MPPREAMPAMPPNVLYHVGVSGGKDSAAALLWMVHESGIPPEKIQATFCDIENDHPATLEHVDFLSRNVHPIETIHPPLGYFELALHKRRFPGAKTRFCTQHLKIYPTQAHIGRLIKEGHSPVAVSGVRADESDDRKDLPEWDYSGTLLCTSWRPLILWSIQDVYALHRKYGIALNPLYALGAQRVGCWPCIMSRKKEIRIIAETSPERIDEIRRWEQISKNTAVIRVFFPVKRCRPAFAPCLTPPRMAAS